MEVCLVQHNVGRRLSWLVRESLDEVGLDVPRVLHVVEGYGVPSQKVVLQMHWHNGCLKLEILLIGHLLAVLSLRVLLLFLHSGSRRGGGLLLGCLVDRRLLGLAIRLLLHWRLLVDKLLLVFRLNRATRRLLLLLLLDDSRWGHLHIDSVILIAVYVWDNGLVLSTLPFPVNNKLVLVNSGSQLVRTTQEQLELVIEYSFHGDGLPTGEGSRYANVTPAPRPLEQVTAQRLESLYHRLLLLLGCC